MRLICVSNLRKLQGRRPDTRREGIASPQASLPPRNPVRLSEPSVDSGTEMDAVILTEGFKGNKDNISFCSVN